MEMFDRMFAKLDKLDDKLQEMDSTLVRQEEVLKEHIRRTNLLEDEIRPIKKHVWMAEAFVKLIGACAVLLGILESIHAIWKK